MIVGVSESLTTAVKVKNPQGYLTVGVALL